MEKISLSINHNSYPAGPVKLFYDSMVIEPSIIGKLDERIYYLLDIIDIWFKLILKRG